MIEKLEDELEFEKKKSKEGSDEFSELEKLRMELGELGGAGHYFGNDQRTDFGGKRDMMEEEDLKKVLRLLAAGEKKINLKEREFRAFLSENKTERNLKKVLGLGRLERRRGWMDDPVPVCCELERRRWKIFPSLAGTKR